MNDKHSVPSPEDGDLFTRNEWISYVKNGYISPEDGSGYWSTETEYDWEFNAFKSPPSWATHVAWFNK